MGFNTFEVFQQNVITSVSGINLVKILNQYWNIHWGECEGISISLWTGHLEWELQMLQLPTI